MNPRTAIPLTIVTVLTLALAGCLGGDKSVGPGQSTTPFPVPASTTSVAGSGATFPKPLIETWALEYAKAQPTIQVSYAGGGSGKGVKDITAKTVAFAGSDAPLTAAQTQAAPGILQIPETLGVAGVVYNVADLADGLKLDGETVGKIYSGDITRWNDAAIAALNPDVTLPDSEIAIVYRSDSSGTTFVFTDWLSKTSPTFASKVVPSANTKPDWTKSTAKQLSGNGNDGVGSLVKTTPNTIGYVELAFVKSLNLKSAALKNKAGEFVKISAEGGAKAAAGAAPSLPAADGDWSKVSIVDAPGAGSYPIATFTYMLVYPKLSDYDGKVTADQLNAFRNWLWWAIHDGQSYGPLLGYATLPAEVVKIGENALNSMTV